MRALPVPVLHLIGVQEVIYDPAKAMARVRQLIPDFDGDLVANSSHDICQSQFRIVNARVLDFLATGSVF